MGSTDPVPDHYDALELSPSCSIDDINKAYKRLALKYHPDRNRGNEEIAVPRFQAIQAAHEVLKDPDTRRRYDLSRAGPGAGSSNFPRTPAQRGNPYKAYSNFPPPPMRTGPRRSPTAGPRTAPTGAQFPPPPPARPQTKTSTNRDARDRANMFEAWNSMHGTRRSPERKSQTSTNTQPEPTKANFQGGFGANLDPRSRPQRASSDDAPPKSAYEQAKAQRPGVERTPSHQAPPRKPTGFDPSTPGVDERPAPSAAYGQARYERDWAAQGPGTPKANGYTQPASGRAPTAKRPDSHSYFDSPHAGSPGPHIPYTGSSTGRPHSTEEDLRRFASTQSATKPHDNDRGPFGRPRDRHRSASPQRSSSGKTAHKIKVYSSDDDSAPESAARASRSATASPMHGPDLKARPKAKPSASWTRRSGTSTPSANSATSLDGAKENIFSIPVQPDMFTRSFSPGQNPPHINTDFTSSTNSTSGFGSPQEGRRASQPANFTFRGAPPQSSSAQPTTNTTPLASPQPPPPRSADGTMPLNTDARACSGTFSASHWAESLQTDNWASRWANPPPQPSGLSASPTRRSKSVKGSVRIPSNIPRPTTVEDEEAGPEPQWMDGDSNAMDVDSAAPAGTAPAHISSGAPPIPPNKPGTTIGANQQPRHVFVEPSKPEWQSRGANGMTSTTIHENLPPPPPGPPPNTRPHRHSLSMNDFRHVAPFDVNSATVGGGPGLADLRDISSALPFQSQASSQHPTKATTTTSLGLARPPKAPSTPDRVTEPEWNAYLVRLATYLTAWSSFRAQMLEHFEQHATTMAKMEQANVESVEGVMPNWLAVLGETEHLKGWASYRRALREEEKVRMYWNVACERHAEAMEGHERLRSRLVTQPPRA